ncbi:MAG: oligosaccharide flippase family protein [Candidatus Dojkabacteria bacterium]|nr:oligosaccharide flippase family protein [Candidatus Dojkabacteria bacterium]
MRNFIKNILDKFIDGSMFKKNIVILVGGRVIAQVVPILLTPLLTRIYSPEEFGVLGVYMAIASFLAIVSNLRYSQAVLLPKEKGKAQGLVFLSTVITLVFSLILFVLIFFFKDFLFFTLNMESIGKYFPLLVLNIMFLSLYDTFFVYELRRKKYKKLALNLIIQALITLFIRIVLGYLGYTEIGLLISYLAGYVIGYVLLLLRTNYKLDFTSFFRMRKELLKEYINFPKFVLLSDSFMSLVTNLPSILINTLFGSTIVGYFSLTEKILGAPIWFITSSVGDVFRQEASELYRKGKDLRKLFVKTTKSMFKLGIIPFLLIFLFVPPLIPYILGEVWEPVGSYIRIFSIMYLSSFVVNPVSNMIYIIKKEKYGVLFQGLKLLSILVGLLLGFYYKNIELGLIIWSVLLTISNILIYGILYKIIALKNFERE